MSILLIPISRKEKDLLQELYPNERFPRTMKQDSKRKHYFAVECEKLMRPIAESNIAAAKWCEEYDKRKSYGKPRQKRGAK